MQWLMMPFKYGTGKIIEVMVTIIAMVSASFRLRIVITMFDYVFRVTTGAGYYAVWPP